MTSNQFTKLLSAEIDKYLLKDYYVGRTYTYNEMCEFALFIAAKTMELIRSGMLKT